MVNSNETLENLRSLLKMEPISILITGDSISYNRYDFDPTGRTNAYDCFPGMQSWSFLLRDQFINSSGGYVHGDVLAAKYIEVTGEGSVRCGYKRAYIFPQYGRVLGFSAKNAVAQLTLRYTPVSSEKIVLYMLSNPLKTSCRFDIYVNGNYALTVANSGENKTYQGFEPFFVELSGVSDQENRISFENIVPDTKEQTLSEIFLVGISSETVQVNISGQGSTTCKWLDDNCEERVLRYAPDLVFASLAGNDIVYSDPDTFETALRSVIQRTREIKPHCGFVFLPMPPEEKETDYIDYDGWVYHKSPVTEKYFEKMYKVAEDTNAWVLDPYELFTGIPVNMWRFDNIHYNQYGNKLLFEHLKSLLNMP